MQISFLSLDSPTMTTNSCTITILQNPSPYKLVLTLFFPQASTLDPEYLIIPHPTQPDSTDPILLFETHTQTFPLLDLYKPDLQHQIASATSRFPIHAEDFSWAVAPFQIFQ